MKMDLRNIDILKLLPEWMREDQANMALAGAVNEIFNKEFERVKTLRIWDQIDVLMDKELDELAWELGIDWYDQSWDIERKRATIKVAYMIMEKRGTKWAVEQLVIAAFGYGEVIEWFEYDGEPYHFKVNTNAQFTENGFAIFEDLISRVKSTRSHLETVETHREIDQKIYVGTVALSNNIYRISNVLNSTPEINLPKRYVACGAKQYTISNVYMKAKEEING